jgi:hypothetical protein
MKLRNAHKKPVVRPLILLVATLFSACKNTPPPAPPADRAPIVEDQAQVDAKRLNNGASKLLDAMKKPSRSFGFAFDAAVNITSDPLKPPEVGKESLEADISPQAIDLKETHGKVTEESKAAVEDDVHWSMAHLAVVRMMSNPMLAIAVGASVAAAPSEDLVGEVAADKFSFDTQADLTPAQKVGLGRAKAVVSAIQNCKGTAWIAKDSGELVKFDIDAELQDNAGQSWTEHYEGLVTPK